MLKSKIWFFHPISVYRLAQRREDSWKEKDSQKKKRVDPLRWIYRQIHCSDPAVWDHDNHTAEFDEFDGYDLILQGHILYDV